MTADDIEDIEEDEAEFYAQRPNKTRIKQDIRQLFLLGQTLSELTPEQLAAFALPENIFDALTQVSRIPPSGARRRQLKYVAAQLHKIDTSAIVEQLARFESRSSHVNRVHHQAERWRDRLLIEGDAALTELGTAFPAADIRLIRQLVRNARKEQTEARPPRSSRQLYRFVKSCIEAAG